MGMAENVNASEVSTTDESGTEDRGDEMGSDRDGIAESVARGEDAVGADPARGSENV